jgi:predicted metal-dependent peptidase
MKLKKKDFKNAALAFDVSVSIPKEYIDFILSSFKELDIKIPVLLFTTEIIQVGNTENFKYNPVTSRGGVDFNKLFDWSNANQVENLIIFTDFYLGSLEEPKNFKCVFLSPGAESFGPFPFGEVINISI